MNFIRHLRFASPTANILINFYSRIFFCICSTLATSLSATFLKGTQSHFFLMQEPFSMLTPLLYSVYSSVLLIVHSTSAIYLPPTLSRLTSSLSCSHPLLQSLFLLCSQLIFYLCSEWFLKGRAETSVLHAGARQQGCLHLIPH